MMLFNISVLNWPLPIRALREQYKTNNDEYSTEHKVKNPNWQEVGQLAIYKRCREVEVGATDFKSGAASVKEEFFELKVSPVEDQSLQQKGKKRRNRKGEKKKLKFEKPF